MHDLNSQEKLVLYFVQFFLFFLFHFIGAFESDFHLPLFQITPPVDQLIFEKDSLLISCHSTWVSHDAYFEWQRNGAGQNSKSRGVTIQHYYNVSHGYYASTMFVKK